MGNLIWKLRYYPKNKKIFTTIIICLSFLYVFSLPSFSRIPLTVYIPYALMSILGAFSLLYTFLYNKKIIKLDKTFVFLPIFIFLAFISTCLYSRQFRSFLTLFLLMLQFFVFYFSFFCFKSYKQILNTIVLALLCFCIYFFIHYRTDILKWFRDPSIRLGGYFDNENHIGEYMSLGFSLSLYSIFFNNKKIDFLHFLPLIIFAFVGLLTGSRSFIILTVSLSFIFIIFRFKKKKIFLIIFISSLIILLAIVINLPELSYIKNQFINMIKVIFNNGSEKSFEYRWMMMKYGFELGGTNLILGYGSDGFSVYSGLATWAHANISESVCNFGLLGTFFFYSFVFIPFLLAFKLKSNFKYIVFAIVIYFLIDSFLIVYFINKSFYIIFAFIYYIVKSKAKDIQSEINYKLI